MQDAQGRLVVEAKSGDNGVYDDGGGSDVDVRDSQVRWKQSFFL